MMVVAATGIEQVQPRPGVGAAVEAAEEEAARGEDTVVRVDKAAVNAECDVAEGLGIDEEIVCNWSAHYRVRPGSLGLLAS